MPGPSQPAKDSQSPRASATPNNASQNPPPLDVMAAYYPDLVQLFEWCQVCKDEHLDIMEKLLRDHYPGFRDFLNVSEYQL